MCYCAYMKKIINVTHPEIILDLQVVRVEIQDNLECKRRPGCVIAIDALLQFWFSHMPLERAEFMADWKTPVHNYPNSRRRSPGQFAKGEE